MIPCSVYIYGAYFLPLVDSLKIAFCDLKFLNSIEFSLKQKSSGNWTSQQKLDNTKSIPHINFILVWGFIMETIHWSFKIVIHNVFSNNFNDVFGFPKIKINK